MDDMKTATALIVIGVALVVGGLLHAIVPIKAVPGGDIHVPFKEIRAVGSEFRTT